MPINRLFIFLAILGATGNLPAQNLLEDGRRLYVALEELKDPASSPDDRHSAAREAMLILSSYNGPAQDHFPEATVVPGLLLKNLDHNSFLRELLPPDHQRFNIVQAHEIDVDEASSNSGRKRIEEIMYGGAPISPIQYLSVQQSLQNSRLPPLQDQAAMRSAAQNVQAAQPATSLGAEALLEGLFQVILKRAQQEMTINFLDDLLHDKLPPIGLLFPNVRDRYSNPAISYSQSFLEGLREAFFFDLKNLNRTLPELLFKDEYFGKLQGDPVFYSVMGTYNQFGLSSNGTSLWESAPLAHRDLFERYEAAAKNLNIYLADSTFTETKEYRQVTDAARAYVEHLEQVALEILELNMKISSNNSGSISFENRDYEEELPARPDFPSNPLYDYRVLNGSNNSKAGFELNLLPDLLQGEFDPTTLRKYNTLNFFDLFFNTSSQEMRIAGLELARRLVDGSWYNDLSHVEILRQWQADLAKYKVEIDQWELSINRPALRQRFMDTDKRRDTLEQVIAETYRHWSNASDAANLWPLIQLQNIAGDFSDILVIDLSYQDSLRMLREREEKLLNLEKRLTLFEQRLSAKSRAAVSDSPLQRYLRREEIVEPIEKLSGEIDQLQSLSDSLREALVRLDTTYAPRQHRTLQSTMPMLQATELLSNLFYVLKDSDSEGLIKPLDFNNMLYEPQLRAACLGLMQQRLSRVRGAGQISPEALIQLAQITLQDFSTLEETNGQWLPGQKPDSLQLFNLVSVSLQALNRILEFPLFADRNDPQTLVSLKTLHPALQFVPDISGHCMNFLYYLETEQHRSAISSMIRMLTSLSEQLDYLEKEKSKPQQKNNDAASNSRSTARRQNREKAMDTEANAKADTNRMALVHFLATYGDFIAGLVDARHKNEVEYLLTSLADPPGSSRTKRSHQLSAGINAYLGLSGGIEQWTRNRTTDQPHFILAPAMPIGFTVSWLAFKKRSRPQSFSLHLTGLDLGAMLTYRLAEEDQFGSYKLSFKNVVKPGAQLQWNFQKSPFYLGLGWQTGAQFREQNGGEIALRSSRFFLSFGLDTPIRTLYAK